MGSSDAERVAGRCPTKTRHCEPTGRANARPMTGSAKQSIEQPQERKLDCFVARAPLRNASRLSQAMTLRRSQTRLRDLAARFARGLPLFPALSKQRAQGMPGARCARRRMCEWGVAIERTRVSQVTPESPGIPHAMVTTACSPASGLFLAVADRVSSTDLTPASGCQDHTPCRPPQALSSKSTIRVHRSPPRAVDVAQRPSGGTGWQGI
jgi:hypothetical protein